MACKKYIIIFQCCTKRVISKFYESQCRSSARLNNPEKQLRIRCYSFPLATTSNSPLQEQKMRRFLRIATYLSCVERYKMRSHDAFKTDWRFIVNNLQRCTVRINCDQEEEEEEEEEKEEEEDRTWGDQGKRWFFGSLWPRSWHCLVAFILLQVRSTFCFLTVC